MIAIKPDWIAEPVHQSCCSAAHEFDANTSAANMANLSLLMVVLLAGALCVQSWTHDGKADHKKKRDHVTSFLDDMLEEEELALRKMDLETDELLETRQASGDDSDDTDESGEAEESAENEGETYLLHV